MFICFTLLAVVHAACHQDCQYCDEKNDVCQGYQHKLHLYNSTYMDECPNDYVMSQTKKYYHENKTSWFVFNLIGRIFFSSGRR